ncbi:MAG: aminoglycoside phosphotransferase family protein, partial [Humibacter sp.]
MDGVEVVVAHEARVTLRVGDTFLKIDSDQQNIDNEVLALGLAPIPTPRVLWQQPSVLAIGAVPGTALGR